MADGKVKDFGDTLQIVKNKNSEFTKFFKKNSPDVFERVYEDVGVVLKQRYIDIAKKEGSFNQKVEFYEDEISFEKIKEELNEKIEISDIRLKNK